MHGKLGMVRTSYVAHDYLGDGEVDFGEVGFWRSGILAKWDFGEVGNWRSGKLAKWEIGEVGNWRSGKLAE